MTTPANPTPEPDGKVPKRGDDVLIEGMAKELRSLRKKNIKLKAENEHLKTVLEQIRPMARIGMRVFNRNLNGQP